MISRTNVITAHELTKMFGDFIAVKNVSFDVHKGEIFGFLGPNGSGKTTTIRMMLGLLSPSKGNVEVLGMSIDRFSTQIRPRVGYMSQRFSLYNDLSVLQNLNFYGAAYGLPKTLLQERIQDSISRAGLTGRENVKTKDLSGGWRQRLALGAAILHRPEVLFLDEPTAGVDPISRRAFWNLLYHLVSEGITVFITTHYMDEAEHCHRLAFIQNGEIIAYGSPSQIKEEIMYGQVWELDPSDVVKAVKVLQSAQKTGKLPIIEVELYGSLVHIVAPKNSNICKHLRSELKRAGVSLRNITKIEPTLEDVFIASMKKY
jgi:ABC-2 type transport system ATP-binding protein